MSLARVRALIQIERWHEALEALKPALGDPGADAGAWCLLAQIQLGLGDAGRAQRAAEQAVAREPDEEWGYRLRAVALMRQRQYPEAHRSILAAARIDPDDALVLSVLATVLMGLDRETEAEQVAQHNLATNPYHAAAWHSGAVVANHRHQYAVAEDRSRRGLAIDPEDNDLLLELSEAVTRQGRAAEAAGYAKTAIALDPADRRGRGHLESSPGRIAAGVGVLVLGAVAAAGVFWLVWLLAESLGGQGDSGTIPLVRPLLAGAAAYAAGFVVLRLLLQALRRHRL